MQLWNLVPLLKFANIKGFIRGTILFPMAMEVHDMDHFIKEFACFFHDRQLGGHLLLYFCIQFLRQCVSIVLQHVLASITI
jgi:hypothetical protein